MPPRVPRLPKAKASEVFVVGAAGVGVLTPLYMIMPGAEERLAAQTVKWAPRWEKNISYFTNPAALAAQRVEPPVSKAVQRIDERLPLEKMTKKVSARIQSGFDRWGPKPTSS